MSTQKTLTLSEAVKLGVKYHEAGNLEQAESIYHQVLQVEPKNSSVLHLLGVISAQRKDFDKAIELINQAISLNGKVPNFYSSLGIALSGKTQWTQAIESFQAAIALNPNHADAQYNLGRIFQHQNQLVEAAKHYRLFLSINPNDVTVNQTLAQILSQQGSFSEAIAHYQRTLAINPDDAETHRLLGDAFNHLGQFQDAMEAYQQALTLNPNDDQTHKHIGDIFRIQSQLESAISSYQQALALNPNDAGTHNNLGIVFNRLGKLKEAMACYEQALMLEPNFVEAGSNLGSTLLYQGQIQKAIEHYQQILAEQPHNVIHSNLLLALHYTTDYDPAALFSEHQKFNEQYAIAISSQPHLNDRQPQRKLKIGYISADFKKHSVAYFMESILAHHDPEQFEIYCYYNGTLHDEVTQRFQKQVHHWVDCASLSDEVLAETIRSVPIDILVDLSGHTDNNRLLVLAAKPAPVQITYLGYSDTTGLTSIDYRISDNYVEPKDMNDSLSSEQIVRMPNSYFCYRPDDDSPPVSELPALKKDFITFGSFNNYAKLNAKTLELWAKVLNAIPNSKLFLKTRSLNDPNVQQTFKTQWLDLGIDSERIILANYAPSTKAHLKTYHQIDIGLDTYPYNGATTTCEALWMGVPVVTLVGNRHVSRMGLSILSTVGLTEVIAQTPEDYLQICIKLANNINYLQELRVNMRERMQHSPLMDGPTFTRDLETNYQKMWETWCED
jgi:protein O-GlcNAc transferase